MDEKCRLCTFKKFLGENTDILDFVVNPFLDSLERYVNHEIKKKKNSSSSPDSIAIKNSYYDTQDYFSNSNYKKKIGKSFDRNSYKQNKRILDEKLISKQDITVFKLCEVIDVKKISETQTIFLCNTEKETIRFLVTDQTEEIFSDQKSLKYKNFSCQPGNQLQIIESSIFNGNDSFMHTYLLQKFRNLSKKDINKSVDSPNQNLSHNYIYEKKNLTFSDHRQIQDQCSKEQSIYQLNYDHSPVSSLECNYQYKFSNFVIEDDSNEFDRQIGQEKKKEESLNKKFVRSVTPKDYWKLGFSQS